MQFKKSYIAFLLATTVGMSACQVDDIDRDMCVDDSANLSSSMMSFSLEREVFGSLSKASLSMSSSGTVSFAFSEKDSLSILSASNNNSQLKMRSVDGSRAVFCGEVSADKNYYALFPYNSTASISNNIISTEIPDNQDGEWDSQLFGRYAISVGCTSNNGTTFSLKNACSLIWLDVLSIENYSSITIEANKNIAGKVNVTVAENINPVVSDGSSASIRIKNPKTNIIPVIPQNNVDIKITLERKSGNGSIVKECKGIDLSRSNIAFITNADAHEASFDTQVDGGVVPSIFVSDNADFELPSIGKIQKPGMNFVGWKASDGEIYPANSIVNIGSTDMKFTAEWSTDFVLSYYIEGQKKQLYQLFKYDEEITLMDAPVLENNTFLYWFDGDGKRAPGSTIKPNKNVTVSAVFEDLQYQVTVHNNGGVTATNGDEEWSSLCKAGGSMDVHKVFNYPIREGYEFGGYYDNPDLLGNPVTFIQNPSADVHLYARWYKQYSIKYLDKDGNLIVDEGVELSFNYNASTYCITVKNPNHYVDSDEFAIGWIDQCGISYEYNDVILISTLDELRDFIFRMECL